MRVSFSITTFTLLCVTVPGAEPTCNCARLPGFSVVEPVEAFVTTPFRKNGFDGEVWIPKVNGKVLACKPETMVTFRLAAAALDATITFASRRVGLTAHTCRTTMSG